MNKGLPRWLSPRYLHCNSEKRTFRSQDLASEVACITLIIIPSEPKSFLCMYGIIEAHYPQKACTRVCLFCFNINVYLSLPKEHAVFFSYQLLPFCYGDDRYQYLIVMSTINTSMLTVAISTSMLMVAISTSMLMIIINIFNPFLNPYGRHLSYLYIL